MGNLERIARASARDRRRRPWFANPTAGRDLSPARTRGTARAAALAPTPPTTAPIPLGARGETNRFRSRAPAIPRRSTRVRPPFPARRNPSASPRTLRRRAAIRISVSEARGSALRRDRYRRVRRRRRPIRSSDASPAVARRRASATRSSSVSDRRWTMRGGRFDVPAIAIAAAIRLSAASASGGAGSAHRGQRRRSSEAMAAQARA